MRRALTISLALTALAAGCGGDDEPAEPSTITVPSPATTTSASATAPAPDGGGEGAGASPSEQPAHGSGNGAPNAAIAAAAVLTIGGTAQQACGTFVTETFIETAYGGEQNCIAARRPDALARSIQIGPEDDINSTRIVVVPKGGPYDGAKVEVDLDDADGGFRVDALDAHVPAGP